MKTKDFDGAILFEAVAELRDAIDAESGGRRLDGAGAERWTVNSEYRQQIWERTRGIYCTKTGCKPWNFPFSVDGVALAFMRYRKDGSDPGDADGE